MASAAREWQEFFLSRDQKLFMSGAEMASAKVFPPSKISAGGLAWRIGFSTHRDPALVWACGGSCSVSEALQLDREKGSLLDAIHSACSEPLCLTR